VNPVSIVRLCVDNLRVIVHIDGRHLVQFVFQDIITKAQFVFFWIANAIEDLLALVLKFE
jgi:hypothetical protein